MRVKALMAALEARDPDDIVGIGVHTGDGWHTATAISTITEGDGIILLCTPQNADFVRPGQGSLVIMSGPAASDDARCCRPGA